MSAPAAVVHQLQAEVTVAVQQLECRDRNACCATCSEQYRAAPLTKPALRTHLQTMFRAL